MQDIRRAVAQASRRLFVTSALQRMVIVFTILTSLLIPAIIIDRLQGGVIDWNAVLPIVALAGLIATLLWAIIKRPSQMAAARELDDRAGLHESLSTALCVAGDDDPWSKAVVASSIDRARSVDVRKAIPIAAPRRWGSPFVSLLLFGILFWTLPVAGARERAEEEQRARAVAEVHEEVALNETKLDRLLENTDIEVEPEEGTNEAEEFKSPDEVRRDAIRKLTKLTEKIAKAQEGQKAEQFKALESAMRSLRQPGPGPLEKLARELARGDYEKAQEALAELSQKLSENELSSEQRAQLQEQLQQLQSQLETAANDRSALEQALAAAGFDPKTAAQASMSTGDLEAALESMENLTEAQKQQLRDLAKASDAAMSQCEGMCDGLGMMSQGLSQDGASQEFMEGAMKMSNMLSDAEMLDAEMQCLSAAMSEAEGQLMSLGASLSPGNANAGGLKAGGPGQRFSEIANPEEFESDRRAVRDKVEPGNGQIIGSRLVYGRQVRGESRAQFATVAEQSARAASDAIEDMVVPRRYQSAVKAYYDRLQGLSDERPPAPQSETGDASDG